MNNIKNKQKGFTLIELLVVIAIIGILSSIVLVSLGTARTKARDARRQSDIRQITLAMELCYDDAGCNLATNRYLSILVGVDGRLTTSAIGNYMNPISTDPGGGSSANCLTGTTAMTVGNYCGIANATDQTQYCIYAKSESIANGVLGHIIAASEKGVNQMTGIPASLTACP